MKLNKVLLFALLTLSLNSVTAMSPNISSPEIKEKEITVSKKSTPKLSIKSSTVKQGEFYEVTVTGVKRTPLVWFNQIAFRAFKTADKEYTALIPVENLTKPGSYAILARADDWEDKVPVTVLDNAKPVQHITLSKSKSGLSASQKELSEISSTFRLRSEDLYSVNHFIYPSNARKSSPFGVKRSYNNAPVSSYHKGLDFAGVMGSPVFAPGDAKVALVGYEKDGYNVHGNAIVLDHGHALTSIYMHLSKIDVKEGDWVTKGQKIGEVGHTGISSGPHLHWGTYLYGISVDPELFVD